ncbi:MAG: hypothetical protein HZA90_09715 [Verrucomicrobia bacterium]|nr:hypothetical protein [Verrucomicrobiota bacterium]
MLCLGLAALAARPIDRHALVTRHNIVLTNADARTPLQVGNGEFAFSADITGLQTFLPANTMSHWGWHTFSLPPGQRPEDLKLQDYDTYGRPVGYATSAKGQEAIYNWLRENPHRFNLGRLALRMTKVDGTAVALSDLKQLRQTLDLWRGLITSRFEIEGQPVQVETLCHPARDLVAVRIESALLQAGRLTVELAFPYGSPTVTGGDWTKPDAHQTTMTRRGTPRADFARRLDADHYAVSFAWTSAAESKATGPHTFSLVPATTERALEFVCAFSLKPDSTGLPDFAQVKSACAAHWPKFWNSGGAMDLSESQDPRWRELERRIVLSQYLMAIQAAGSLPPQESCLVNNGWNGKFHLEMHWWHAVQFALWDRWPLFERSLGWYRQTLPVARRLAASQGYRGARWPKMVGPDGRDAPSGVGPLLIWQQPHPIYYANLDYRLHPTRETLERWRDVVFDTAEFLASFAVLDKATGCYALGPPIRTVPENTDPRAARNPTFELSYWRFGLRVAQQWREKLGLPREAVWDQVLRGLAPLPTQDGVYLPQEGLTNAFTKWNWEHPSLVGPLGMLPGDGADPATMRATVKRVWQTWDWERKNWGWDFPMMAMAAARNGEPELAIEAMFHPTPKNQFVANGFSTGGPYPYFPSNGGLLAAVAMMAAGWDGCADGNAPGFPRNGKWIVRWEGLKRLP